MKESRTGRGDNKERLERIIREVGMPPSDPEEFERWWESHWQEGRGLEKLASAAGFTEEDLLDMFREAEGMAILQDSFESEVNES